MAGPLDILRSLQGNAQQQTPDVKLPGFDSSSNKALLQAAAQLKTINSLVKKGKADWRDYADARSLTKATKSLSNLKIAQRELNKSLATGNASMQEQVDLYTQVAEAQAEATQHTKEANYNMNENRGVVGRASNALNKLAENKGMAAFAATIHDANIVLGDMNQKLGIMARTGQVSGQTFGSMAKETAKFSWEMRKSMMNAAMMGQELGDSNDAFLMLTETYGGNAEKLAEMSDKWEDLALLATVSGLSMRDVANMADQGFRRLGESLTDTANNITLMSKATAEMNTRYGKGSVNIRDYSDAVNTLAYSQGFYNQNTKMVIDTLSREINMQLALGRSRQAAVMNAQKNLEMAGKVNLVGIKTFRAEMNAAYQAAVDKGKGAEHLEEVAKKFGAEGEILAHMMKQGTLMSSDNLFAVRNLVQESTALSANMMEGFRVSALQGPGQLLSMGVGLDDSMRLVAESRMVADKLAAVAGGGDASKMFKGREKDPEVSALIARLRDREKPMSKAEMLSAFYKIGDADQMVEGMKEKKPGEAQQQPWEKYISDKEGLGWFGGMTKLITNMAASLGEIPSALATLGAALLGKSVLAKFLGNLPVAGGAAGGAGRAMMSGGPMGALLAALGTVGYGAYNAEGILEKDQVSMPERIAAGGANLVTAGGTFGDRKSIATADTPLHNLIYDKTYGRIDSARDMWIDKTETSSPYAMVKQAIDARSKAGTARPSSPGAAAPDGRGGGGDAGEARAESYFSGGSLILEVSNWADIYAQSMLDAVGNES